MKNKRILITALLFAIAGAAHATDGINLIGIGPVQQGTAGAGVASAKDSSWLLLNPAGLTDLGSRADASFQVFAPNRSLRSGMSGGAGKQTDDSIFFIPEISATFDAGDGNYWGIGIYGTSGMGVDYDAGRIGTGGTPTTPPTTAQRQFDKMTELSVAKLTLTYARELNNGWSIGGGPVFVLSRLRTDMLNPFFVPQSGDWDTAVGAGFILGVNKKVNDKLSLGASYLSEQFTTEFDEYDALLAGSLNLPQQLTIGLAYNLYTNLEVALDYKWIGWGQLDTLGDQFGWDDQNIVKVGLSWGATDRLTLRGGISHGNSPIGNGFTTFANALFPAIMETHLSGGLSYQFDAFRLDLAYTHALEASRTDAATRTDISMYQNSLTIGAGWEF